MSVIMENDIVLLYDCVKNISVYTALIGKEIGLSLDRVWKMKGVTNPYISSKTNDGTILIRAGNYQTSCLLDYIKLDETAKTYS